MIEWYAIADRRVHYLDAERGNSGCDLLIVHGYLDSTDSFLDLIDIPRRSVLILVGSEDKLLCAEDYEKVRHLLSGEQLEIIEESGHLLYLDSPEVVSRKIVTFTRGGRE